MRTTIVVLTAVAAFLAGVMLAVTVQTINQPDCPTEDSCAIDYRDGGWHITEVTP